MTLNSEGIMPCPLCWHVAREADPVHSTEAQIDAGYGPLSFGVECGADLECGCKVEGFPDQASAIAAWNRRALPPVDGLEVVAWDVAPKGLPAEPTKSHSFVAEIERQGGSITPLVALSQSSSVIAGLTAERDEARAEVERMTPKFVAYDYLESPAGREAAEARISSLEEENKRLREALEGVMKEETFSLHVGYDNATGGGNFVYADVIRTDSDAFLAARQALEDHNG